MNFTTRQIGVSSVNVFLGHFISPFLNSLKYEDCLWDFEVSGSLILKNPEYIRLKTVQSLDMNSIYTTEIQHRDLSNSLLNMCSWD